MIIILNLHSRTKLSGWLRHWKYIHMHVKTLFDSMQHYKILSYFNLLIRSRFHLPIPMYIKAPIPGQNNRLRFLDKIHLSYYGLRQGCYLEWND